jgi:phosphomevalonate kinase
MGSAKKPDTSEFIEKLKDALGPAADLLDGLIEESDKTPGLTREWAEWASASIFAARFEEWKQSWSTFTQAYNENLEDAKRLLSALNRRLEKDSSLTQEQRDMLVSFRVSLQNLADNEPIKDLDDYRDEKTEEEYCCAADCDCKR